MVYLSVFSIEDPFFYKIKRSRLKPVEENTFYLPKINLYRHFFTEEELKESFDNFEIIYLREKRFKDISHARPHFHQIVELIAKK